MSLCVWARISFLLLSIIISDGKDIYLRIVSWRVNAWAMNRLYSKQQHTISVGWFRLCRFFFFFSSLFYYFIFFFLYLLALLAPPRHTVCGVRVKYVCLPTPACIVCVCAAYVCWCVLKTGWMNELMSVWWNDIIANVSVWYCACVFMCVPCSSIVSD